MKESLVLASLVLLTIGAAFSGPLPNYAQDKEKKPTDVDALIAALNDKDMNVQMKALASLGRAGPDAKAAIPAITILLKDKEPLVGIYAAAALRRNRPQNQTCVARDVESLACERRHTTLPCRRRVRGVWSRSGAAAY